MFFVNKQQRSAIPKGCTPITDFNDQDIFVAGYPKSGNTWFQELISDVVFGVAPELCPPLLLQDLVPDVHFKDFYTRYRTPMFFKTHHLPRPEYKRVVYLMRDGRDVMTSYFHHASALNRHPVDFMMMVKNGRQVFPCQWHEHIQAWKANPYHASILTIRYEDLHEDATREMLRFCSFAGIRRGRDFVEQMTQANSFEKMQRKEAREQVYVDPRWPKDKRFRRRGEVGSHRDEMPAPVLKAFLAQAGPTLRECGYLVEALEPRCELTAHSTA